MSNANNLPEKPSREGERLWQIGAFDGTSDEFMQGYRGQRALEFIVGKSEEAKDWGCFQPMTREKRFMRSIQFTVDSETVQNSASYRLTMALLIERAGVPVMLVSVNGNEGRFYLHPRLDNRMGDATGGNRTVYSEYTLVVDIPREFLKEGVNTISFLPLPAGKEYASEAGINYDALELRAMPGGTPPPVILATAVPMIFYKNINGKLHEQVNVYVRYLGRLGRGTVTLKIGGEIRELSFEGDQVFGEERLEFLIPEFTGEQDSLVTVKTEGRQLSIPGKARPHKKWTLYSIPNTHLDVGYTDRQAKVEALQSRILEQAMDLTEHFPDFRYSVDGVWPVHNFMDTRSHAEQERLMGFLRERKLYMPVQYAGLLTGFPTAETLLRSFYRAANYSREYGIPFEYANLSDVPTQTWSYPSVLAAAGIKYFLAASNSDRGPAVLIGRYNESPMWWEGPDGKRVMYWYTRVYRHMQMNFGMPPLLDTGRDLLPVYMQMYSTDKYHADAVVFFGGQDESREMYPQQATLAERWNAEYAYPKIVYSGVAEAMEEVARQFGDRMPVLRACGGGYWEDGVAANPLRVGINRATERRAPSAEKLTAVATLLNPRLKPDRDRFRRMWDNVVLYDEHTQVVSNAMPAHDSQRTTIQLNIKNQYADYGRDLADHLIMTGAANLADCINVGRGHLVVYNTLNWKRDALISFDLRSGSELLDLSTGETVPFEVSSRGSNFRRVNFLASGVPAMGYKVYRIRPASAQTRQEMAEETSFTPEDFAAMERGIDVRPPRHIQQKNPATLMESRFYRVELDAESGAVKSVYDKELSRELVDKDSPYKFGQYVYVTGGDAKPNSILQYAKKQPEMEVHVSEKGRIICVNEGPEYWSAKLESTAVFTPKISTEIRVWKSRKKIEFINEVRKNQVYRREGVYFAFPFAVKEPQFLYEIQNGVVDPEKNIFYGGCLEWFMAQGWMGVQEKEAGAAGVVMSIDAPLFTLGDVIRGDWMTEFGKRPATIFSHVVNNYHQPRTIIDFKPEVKEDRLTFRYVITSAEKLEPARLSRLAWEEMTPMEWNEVITYDRSWVRPQALDGKQGSFVEIEDDNVVLTTWKNAEDGKGTIMRFLDLGGGSRQIMVKIPFMKLSCVRLTDAVERNISEIDISSDNEFCFDIRTNEIVTIRIDGSSVLHMRSSADGIEEAHRGNTSGL